MPNATAKTLPSRRRVWLNPWVPVLLGLASTLLSLGNGFAYDDLDMVVTNTRLHSLSDWQGLWLSGWWEVVGASEDVNLRQDPLYRPLTLFSFAVNYAIHGLQPFGYHLVNVLLHGLCCWLVWRFALRLTDSAEVASIAGVLFAIHPVHVEAVAGIVGRAEILAALFLLLGLLTMMPYATIARAGRAAAAAPLFLLALLAKETAICYPVLAGFGLAWSARGRRPGWRWWPMHVGCLLVPLLIYFPLRWMALDSRLFRDQPGVILNPLVLAEGAERVLGAFTVLGWYTRLMLVPSQLSCDYGLAVIDPRTGVTAMALLGVIAAVALGGCLLGAFARQKGWRRVSVIAAMALASYALISNTVLLIGVSVAERLMYWPSVPILMLVALGIHALWQHYCRGKGALANISGILRGLGVVLVLLLTLRCATRCLDWASTLTLARHDARQFPQSAHLNRGYAQELFRIAEPLPAGEQRESLLAEALSHVNLALTTHPPYADALVVRGRLHAATGQIETARSDFDAALQLQPGNAAAIVARAELEGSAEQVDERLRMLRERVAAEPNSAPLRLELARMLLALEQPRAARDELLRAQKLAPNDVDVLRTLGAAQAMSGERAAALKVYERVAALKPNDWAAHANLARLIAEHDPAAALPHAERAYELQPQNVQVCVNLAELYDLNGKTSAAIALYRQVADGLSNDDPYRAVIEARISELERR